MSVFVSSWDLHLDPIKAIDYSLIPFRQQHHPTSLYKAEYFMLVAIPTEGDFAPTPTTLCGTIKELEG